MLSGGACFHTPCFHVVKQINRSDIDCDFLLNKNKYFHGNNPPKKNIMTTEISQMSVSIRSVHKIRNTLLMCYSNVTYSPHTNAGQACIFNHSILPRPEYFKEATLCILLFLFVALLL